MSLDVFQAAAYHTLAKAALHMQKFGIIELLLLSQVMSSIRKVKNKNLYSRFNIYSLVTYRVKTVNLEAEGEIVMYYGDVSCFNF